MQIAGFSKQIERSFNKLGSDISKVVSEVHSLKQSVAQDREDIRELQEDRDCLAQRLDVLEEAIEANERDAKKSNLKFFGVQEPPRFRRSPVESVVEVLNNYSAPDRTYGRRWELRDIAKAFRVQGDKRYPDEPRPIVVQFVRCDDKMDILRDRDLRDAMREDNIRVTSDLTTHQRGMIDFHKKQGKIAFFRQGNLHVLDRAQHTGHQGASSGEYSNYRPNSTIPRQPYRYSGESDNQWPKPRNTRHEPSFFEEWNRPQNHERYEQDFTNIRNFRSNTGHFQRRTYSNIPTGTTGRNYRQDNVSGQERWNSYNKNNAHVQESRRPMRNKSTQQHKEMSEEYDRERADRLSPSPSPHVSNAQTKRPAPHHQPRVVPGDLTYSEVVKPGPVGTNEEEQSSPEHEVCDSDESFHLFDDVRVEASPDDLIHEKDVRRIATNATFTVEGRGRADEEEGEATEEGSTSDRHQDERDNESLLSSNTKRSEQDTAQSGSVKAHHSLNTTTATVHAQQDNEQIESVASSASKAAADVASGNNQPRSGSSQARSPRPRTRSAATREARKKTEDDPKPTTEDTGSATRKTVRSRSQSTIQDAFSRATSKDKLSDSSSGKKDGPQQGADHTSSK
jgi:hypothetical protein